VTYTSNDSQSLLPAQLRGVRLLACMLLALCGSGRGWCGAEFALTPDAVTLSSLDAGGRLTWDEESGRHGGMALRLSATDDAIRFSLFDAPRPISCPNLVRAEAWVRAEQGECEVVVALYDAETGEARGRHTILSAERNFAWQYGACDLDLTTTEGILAYNIEVVAQGKGVSLEALNLFAADSILANGDFRQISGFTDDQRARKVPAAWRRLYETSSHGTAAEGSYRVEEREGRNVLVIEKGEGSFVLGSEVLAIPENTAGFVARASVAGVEDSAPILAVRQADRRGHLSADRSNWIRLDKAADTAFVSSHFIEVLPDGNRVSLLLRLPHQAGQYRFKAVELVSLETRGTDLQLLVDQVGYDADEPLRFIGATDVFPKAGRGTFVLTGADGQSYSGELTPKGRSVGANESDWGKYYFEGIVPEAAAGTYTLTATLGDATTVAPVTCGPNLRLRETGELAYRFYYVQRCGYAVPGWHEQCHMDDGTLPDGTHVDVTGGYHNAGDYNKHMGNNTPISMYGMISAYESHQEFFNTVDRDGDGRADLLDEAMWGADWLRKMVDPESGHMWYYVGNDIDFFGIPELETDNIPGTKDDRWVAVNTPGQLEPFVIAGWAVLARHADRDTYLNAAEELWAATEDRIMAGDSPAHILAALELHRTTGNEKYRAAADALIQFHFGAAKAFDATAIPSKTVYPAALALYALAYPDAPATGEIKGRLTAHFAEVFRVADIDNPFGIVRDKTKDGLSYFWPNCGYNTRYSTAAWHAYTTARLFPNDEAFAARLRAYAADQAHWQLGMNPLELCMLEGKGTSHRIYYHHRYADIPGRSRGAVPGTIPNGFIRAPGNIDAPWFDFSSTTVPSHTTCEPWLPHNAYYLLMLSAKE
jgi:hypothetical protein